LLTGGVQRRNDAGRLPIAGYKHRVRLTDDGQTTAVTKNFSREIAVQLSKFMLEDISYRRE
jgi:hypothetical protein